MDHAEIIDGLGGYRTVAAELGENPTTVQNWRRRGIPGRFWPAVERLAARLGVPGITVESLEAARSAQDDAA